MKIAETVSQLSSATRLQVGCYVVKENHKPLSIGYNGTPEGWDNCCEDENGKTKDDVLHAEHNALTKLAKSTESSEGAIMFITHAPCVPCAKLIHQCGIKTVYFQQHYKSTDGLTYLTKAGVKIIKLYREYPA